MRLIVNRCTDPQTDTRQTDRHKIEKKIKKNNTPVNAGPQDTEYLYYPIDVEGVTLTGSLLPASIQ